jgi:hypothetical protein
MSLSSGVQIYTVLFAKRGIKDGINGIISPLGKNFYTNEVEAS